MLSKEFRYQWAPGSVCHYEWDQQAPTSFEPQALQASARLAQQLRAKWIPEAHVMRCPVTYSLAPSGWLRFCLLAERGELAVQKTSIDIHKMVLAEGVCQVSSSSKNSHSWIDLGTFGAPILTIQTDSVFGSLSHLAQILQAFQDTCRGLGLHHPKLSPRWDWSLIHPDGERWEWRWSTLRETPSTLYHKHRQMLSLDSAPPQTSPPISSPLHTEPSSWIRDRELSPIQFPWPPKTNSPPQTGFQWRQQWLQLGHRPQDVEGILASGRVELFEKIRQISPKISAQHWFSLLSEWPRALRREGVPVHQVTSKRWLALASLFAMGRCPRETLRDLLMWTALFPHVSVRQLLEDNMGLRPLSPKRLRADFSHYLEGPAPRAKNWEARERFWMGRLMRQLRGRIPGHQVRNELHRFFAENPTPDDQCAHPPEGHKKHKKRNKRP